MLQNAYFLAKIGADTAENEQRFAESLPRIGLARPSGCATSEWVQDYTKRLCALLCRSSLNVPTFFKCSTQFHNGFLLGPLEISQLCTFLLNSIGANRNGQKRVLTENAKSYPMYAFPSSVFETLH